MLVSTTRITSSISWSRKPWPSPRPALASSAIPLSRLDYVDFVRRSGVSGLSSVVAPFVELVRRILQRKLAELEFAAAPSPSTLALAAAVGRSVAPTVPSAPQALRPHASRATPAP